MGPRWTPCPDQEKPIHDDKEPGTFRRLSLRLGRRQGGYPLLRTMSLRQHGPSDQPAGGASRDRTDDLKLAKLALSQLSYGPVCQTEKWWARKDLNLRPHAYQACALTS